jgi:predicted P-loop ATPase/GTPase
MTKKILIIGLKEIESGKTNISRALISYIKDKNYDVCGFKPFSGNNIWYNYNTINKTLSEGRIYGKDALLLNKESTLDVKEELINPIHRLWNEPQTIDPLTQLPNFIMDRISIIKKENEEHILLINENNKNKIPKKYLKKINEKHYKKYTIKNSIELNKSIKSFYKKAVKTNYNFIKKKFDYIVIESYSDNVLSPWEGLNHFDIVIAIKPWKIFIYDSIKFEKALELLKPLYSWEISAGKIIDLIKPIKTINIKQNKSGDIIPYLKNKAHLIIDLLK